MPRVKPGERRRAKQPKTRTGCTTCKIRHVKCDEGKPECNRCLTTGRKCDGYAHVWVRNDFGLMPLRPSQLKGHGSDQERRAFMFFRERTSRQLTGLYDCLFWNKIVLQAAEADAGVRHALVALASLHERFEVHGAVQCIDDNFALQQYNLAIKDHLNSLVATHEGATIDIYLAPCLIFICIEMIQGHYQSALNLVKRAVKLLYDAADTDIDRSAWPLEVFETLFGRLQSQGVGLIGLEALGQAFPPRLQGPELEHMPERFNTVLEARRHFEYTSHLSILGEKPNPERAHPSEHELRMRHRAAAWSQAFDHLIADKYATMEARDRQAVTMLEIRRKIVMLSIQVLDRHPDAFEYPMLWDFCIPQCEEIVALAESVMQTSGLPDLRSVSPAPSSASSSSGAPSLGPGPAGTPVQSGTPTPTGALDARPSPYFTLDSTIIGPMYDIARLCRDPGIRRRAIRLLRDYPCREGLWDSVLAARVSQLVMDIEESEAGVPVTCAADIPEAVRIKEVIPVFDMDGSRAKLALGRMHLASDGLAEARSMEETIEC